MKVLHCQKCNLYSTEARVEIITSIRGKLQEDGTWIAWDADFSLPRGHLNLTENQEMLCPECDNPYTIIDVDDCPHEWRAYIGDKRKCEICGVIQKGEIVWPTN